MTRLAFYFDSSACSGCKACQLACKDKNDLPVGQKWRRVYEVTGGGWRQQGPACTQRQVSGMEGTGFAFGLELGRTAAVHNVNRAVAGRCP